MAMFDVIKFNGDGDTLVYRYPEEDFNTKSQLIVQQSQEAIFYYRGAMADHFVLPGHYTLNTQNIPILCKLVNLPFGKESPFTATIYFIDKTERPNNLWGIGNVPFKARDFYDLPLSLGLGGQYSYRISDSVKFINRVLGTVAQYNTADVTELIAKFIQRNVLNYMTAYLKNADFDLFTFEEKLFDLSDDLKNNLGKEFDDYGFELTQMIVTNISKHEDTENYKRYYAFRTIGVQKAEIDIGTDLISAKKRAEIEIANVEKKGKLQLELELEEKRRQADAQFAMYSAQQKQVEAQADINIAREHNKVEAERARLLGEAEAAVLAAKGLTGAQEKGFEVALATAQNAGAGGMASTGMGLGMMAGTVGPTQTLVGGIYSDALSSIYPNNDVQKKVGDNQILSSASDAMSMAGLENIGLGSQPGTNSSENTRPINNQQTDRKARLMELKDLHDSGLLSNEDFEAKKKEILSQI